MAKLPLIFICFSFFIIAMSTLAESQDIKPGDIFSDNFDNASAKPWLDMSAWGFGVWHIEDGVFVSIDSSNVTQQLCSALPNLEHAIVNRDYTCLFNYMPVSGKNYAFTIDVRQEGWSNYKIEISNEGVISILKNSSGKMPAALYRSPSGQIVFDEWQWLRLDVMGEDQLAIKVKVWPGEIADEPMFYNAVALDENPLAQQKITLALTTIQDGGAHTKIDDFNMYSKIPASPLWQMIGLEDGLDNKAKEHFLSGDQHAAEVALKDLQGKYDKAAYLNNLAIITAETNNFRKALQLQDQAYQLSPNHEILNHNLKWIWHCLNQKGLIKPSEDGAIAPVFVKSNKRVYQQATEAKFKIAAFHSIFNSSEDAELNVVVHDDSSNEMWTSTRKVPVSNSAAVTILEMVDLSKFKDGNYRVSVTIKNGKGDEFTSENSFEIIHNEYQVILNDVAEMKSELLKLQSQWFQTPQYNDPANLEVSLFTVEKYLNDCEGPGLLQLYRGNITTALSKAKSLLGKLQNNESPFHHETGQFMRGYYSDIDGSLQGYAVYTPATYNRDEPFPLVINLHGYDPSFSSWQQNPFLPMFAPHATAHDRYIVVNPFGRGNTVYQNVGEYDVLSVIAEVKRLYNIDDDRVYLTGGSMGGAGTWNIGLRYPDTFAAIAPIMGPTEFAFWNGPLSERTPAYRKFFYDKMSALSIAENAINYPMFCNHGVLDDIVPVEQSRKIAKRLNELDYNLEYVEHPEAKHGGFKPEMEQGIFDWFEDLSRESHPKKVVYKTANLRHNKSYWVTINRFIDIMDFAEIEVEMISDNTVEVKVANVAQISLDFSDELFDMSKPVRIMINGRERFNNKIPSSKTVTLHAKLKKDGRVRKWTEKNPWKNQKLSKNEKISGPILDAYNSGFFLVYGTSGTELESQINKKEAESFSAQWESWQHVPCRIKKDVDLSADDIESYNLILIGSIKSNSIISQLNNELPIQFKKNSIVVGNKRFSGEDIGISMIYPNPLNPERYIVIQAGTTWKGTAHITKRLGTEFDYIVFDERTMGLNIPQGNLAVDGTPLLCGFFDQDWLLSSEYQWDSDDAIRNKIVPRNLPELTSLPVSPLSVHLSEVEPAHVEQWYGIPQMKRNYWGHAFQVDGKTFDEGIGVFPNSTLIYNLNEKWDTFSAILSAELNPHSDLKPEDYSGGKVQFAIHGDGHELLVSRVMDVNSMPQKVNISVRGINELKLMVLTQDWLPYFAQSCSWIDAKVERSVANQ